MLALTMACSLTACGGSAKKEEPAKAEETKAAEEKAEEAKAEGAEGSEEAGEEEKKDYSWYTIRFYTNGNTTQMVDMVTDLAAEAGFTVSIDDSNVVNGADAVIQAANENKDGDFLDGFNDTLWYQILDGKYENLKIADWKPTWADKVGDYVLQDKVYGRGIQNVMLLYRTDEFGTNGEKLSFEHWSDIVDSGYTWYRQNKVGGTTNTNTNNAFLYPYVDPESEAGGISVEGWKKLWRFCADGQVFMEDTYGFDPLNRGDVNMSIYFTSALYGAIQNAADSSEHPLKGTTTPENWELLKVDDGTYYIAEYMGILDRPGRTPEEEEVVRAFAEWFGSTEVRAIIAEDRGTFPCNEDAAAMLYPDGVPEIFTSQKNMALTEVAGTGKTYLEYVNEHIAEWNNIQTNLGFYWSDQNSPVAEPDWDNIDWATITKSGASK